MSHDGKDSSDGHEPLDDEASVVDDGAGVEAGGGEPGRFLALADLVDGATVGGPAGEPVVELRVVTHALGLKDPHDLFQRLVREGLLVRDVHYFDLSCESPDKSGRGRPSKRGRPWPTRYLTEVGAVLFTMRARTPLARKMQQLMALVFKEWRHGRLSTGAPAAGHAVLCRLENIVGGLATTVSLIATQGAETRTEVSTLTAVLTALVKQNESLAKRMDYAEKAIAQNGAISEVQRSILRCEWQQIITYECMLGRHGGNRRAASRDIQNGLGRECRWGDRGQTWHNLPVHKFQGARAYLVGRVRAALNDLGRRSVNSQQAFNFPRPVLAKGRR